MGANCKITIPAHVRIHDFAIVFGGLSGCEITVGEFTNGERLCRSAEITGIRYRIYDDMPTCPTIKLPNDRHALYHFEFDDDGNHGITPRSTPFAIALGLALVDFFGGSVDFNDCDDVDVDYQRDPVPTYREQDGDSWQTFQDRMIAVKPITTADWSKYTKQAAYLTTGEWNI